MFSSKKTAATGFQLHEGIKLSAKLVLAGSSIQLNQPVYVPFENQQSYSDHYPVGATFEAGKIECLNKKYSELNAALVVKDNIVLGILTPKKTHISRFYRRTEIVSYQRANSDIWINVRPEVKLTDIPELITSKDDIFIDKRGKRQRDSIPADVQLVAGKKYVYENQTIGVNAIFAVDLTKDKKIEVIGEIINKNDFYIPHEKYEKCTTVTPLAAVVNIGPPKKSWKLRKNEEEFLFFSKKQPYLAPSPTAEAEEKENQALSPVKKEQTVFII